MKNDMEVKGRLKWYLRWPIVLNIIVGLMAIGAILVDHSLGILMGIFFLMHFVFSVIVTFYSKPAIMEELINFGLHFGQVQKKLLHELEVPYGVLDRSGRFMWGNDALSRMVGSEALRKNIQEVFTHMDMKKLSDMKDN